MKAWEERLFSVVFGCVRNGKLASGVLVGEGEGLERRGVFVCVRHRAFADGVGVEGADVRHD